MKNNSQLLMICLSSSLFLSTIAEHKSEAFHHVKKTEEKELSKDEHKQQFLSKIAAGLGVAIVGGYLSQRECLEGTGADVGLVVSTLLMSLSCFAEGNNAAVIRSMAFAATPLAMMGVGLSSETVSGKDGLLAKYGYLGIDKLFKNTTGNSKYGLLTLLSISTYLASKPLIDEASSIAEDMCSSTFNKAKHFYHSKRK